MPLCIFLQLPHLIHWNIYYSWQVLARVPSIFSFCRTCKLISVFGCGFRFPLICIFASPCVLHSFHVDTVLRSVILCTFCGFSWCYLGFSLVPCHASCHDFHCNFHVFIFPCSASLCSLFCPILQITPWLFSVPFLRSTHGIFCLALWNIVIIFDTLSTPSWPSLL